jgi:hypothetical protein
MNPVNENCGPDFFAQRVRAALAEINRQDCPAGMILWLEDAAPEIYLDLTDRLPAEIHRLWTAHASVKEFEESLARFTVKYKQARELYLKHLENYGRSYADRCDPTAKHQS